MKTENNKNINKSKENKDKQSQEPKMYEDYKSFQGLSFENNINSINQLYFGLGMKISEIPFLIKDENTEQNLLCANRIQIKSPMVDKVICYPKKINYIIFYVPNANSIFYLNQNNHLEVYELKNDKIKSYSVPHDKDNDHKIIQSDIKCNNLEGIFNSIKAINEKNSILDNYEILYDIIKNKLRLDLQKAKLRKKNETLTFRFTLNNFKYTVEITNRENEVDAIGMIREDLYVEEGKVKLEEGINTIIDYVKLKKEKNNKAKEFINNSFKCPIIYKNFDDKIIPKNQTLLMEIKSGFDISSVNDQLNSRINLLNECFFKEGERPEFFIGLINLDSKNIEKLSQYIKTEFNFNNKTLIISCIDYEYCDMDLSYEVHNDYILYKELKKLEKKIDNTKFDLGKKIDNLNVGITLNNNKFDSLVETLKKFNPGFDAEYHEILKNKNKLMEDSKNSN